MPLEQESLPISNVSSLTRYCCSIPVVVAAPPYIIWEVRIVSGAAVSTGFFFLCFCGFCAWFGLNGRVRGGGRSKWFGVQEMRIDRPPLGGPGNKAYYPTGAAAALPKEPPDGGGFFASLPSATTPLDPAREGLLFRGGANA